jgi:hypothetical protein
MVHEKREARVDGNGRAYAGSQRQIQAYGQEWGRRDVCEGIAEGKMKNRILETLAAPLFYLVLLSSVVLAFPARSEEVSIEGTSLRVTLPPNWELGPTKLGTHILAALHYKGEPGFEIEVSQFTNWPQSVPTPMGLPFECDLVLSAFRKMPDGRIGNLTPRPDYFPEEFYSRVLLVPSPQQSRTTQVIGCLFLGNSSVVVSLQPSPPQMQVSNLTQMLRAIVEAGKHQSTLLYAPGQNHLPVLNIAVSFSSGSWGVGRQTLPS